MGNAIVTGASGGIGIAIVRKFAQNGINCWACASQKNEEFEKAIQEIEQETNAWITPMYFNMLCEDEIKAEVKKIVLEKKGIDILVNNAGVSPRKTLIMTSPEEIRNVMEINFVAPMIITQIVSRVMIKGKKGSIVNIASVSGCEYAEEGGISYGASKAALIQATKSLSKELAHYNIRVNAVSPGFIDTKMWRERNKSELSEAEERSVMRRMGRADEVANTVFFLTSNEASYITGSNIFCHGGGRITLGS